MSLLKVAHKLIPHTTRCKKEKKNLNVMMPQLEKSSQGDSIFFTPFPPPQQKAPDPSGLKTGQRILGI